MGQFVWVFSVLLIGNLLTIDVSANQNGPSGGYGGSPFFFSAYSPYTSDVSYERVDKIVIHSGRLIDAIEVIYERLDVSTNTSWPRT
jgi:hypothetical protein